MLIYDSSHDCNAKKITAFGKVSLTENAKTVFASLSILQQLLEIRNILDSMQ